MNKKVWFAIAMLSCLAVFALALCIAGYISFLVYPAGGPIWATVSFALCNTTLMRAGIQVMTWFWPEQASPAWLEKNPPLFRFDLMRGK
jgi:hypothetical protein